MENSTVRVQRHRAAQHSTALAHLDARISRCGRCGSWQLDGQCHTGHQDDPAGRPPASTTSTPEAPQ